MENENKPGKKYVIAFYAYLAKAINDRSFKTIAILYLNRCKDRNKVERLNVEDVLYDSLLKMLELKIPYYPLPNDPDTPDFAKIDGWMHNVIKFHIFNLCRKKGMDSAERMKDFMEITLKDTTPEVDPEKEPFMEKCIANGHLLQPADRKILKIIQDEEIPPKEISRKYGIPQNTITNAFYRLRKQYKECLEKYHAL